MASDVVKQDAKITFFNPAKMRMILIAWPQSILQNTPALHVGIYW